MTPVPDTEPVAQLPQEGPPTTGDRVGDWMYHFNDPKLPAEAFEKNRFGPAVRYPVLNGKETGPTPPAEGESLWDIIRSLFGGK